MKLIIVVVICRAIGGRHINTKILYYLVLNINTSHPLQKQQLFITLRKSFKNLRSIPMVFQKYFDSIRHI